MLRVGVVGCSSFAKRAMIPALMQTQDVKVTAVASRSLEKAKSYAEQFACEAVEGYDELLKRPDIDAVYMPLPTGLHEEWINHAIEAGKHLLIEKSLAGDFETAQRLVNAAREKGVLLVENYLFPHHSQFKWVTDYLASGELGDVRLIRSTFGFPPLNADNFRYNMELGGGALLDAGGYVLKISNLLLGPNTKLVSALLEYDQDRGVDMYGDGMLVNDREQVAQVSFGFNYFYQCTLEILGTKGKLTTDRIFTAPPGFMPTMIIEHQNDKNIIKLPPDNHYHNMVCHFRDSIENVSCWPGEYEKILAQASIQWQFRELAGTIA